MPIHFEETDDKLIIRFLTSRPGPEREHPGFREIAERAAVTKKKVLVSFRDVEFMTSAIIGEFVLLSQAIKAERISIQICNLTPNVRQVFRITKLDKVFSIVDDEDDDGLGQAGVPG